MFRRLFNRYREREWVNEIRRGILIRKCRYTGRMEYRDCKTRTWIAVKDEKELEQLAPRELSSL